MSQYDIVIAGGGLIGTSLAIALQKTNKNILLIEAKPPELHEQTNKDMRSLALNYASIEFLKSIHIWDEIKSFATPIQKIHVSEQKRFGKVLLDSQELGFDFFGYVIPIPILYKSLINKTSNISIGKITEIKKLDDSWQLNLNNQIIQTKLLIAADGDKSFIRETLNIPTEKYDYEQTAIVTTAKISKPHQNTAYERFTPHGVLAIMPREDNHVGIILTTNQAELKNNLLEFTQKSMGYRLGKFFDLGEIQTYPLKFLHAHKQAFDNLILIGNAAHVLHPVASQGFNLGLKDVAVLSQLIINQEPNLIELYLQNRGQDQISTENFTHKILNIFKIKTFPLPFLRSIGMGIFDLIPYAKRQFCLKAMGIN